MSRDLELGRVPAVSASTKKVFSDFSEIWCVNRGRLVMHDRMPNDPMQGQGQGHE